MKSSLRKLRGFSKQKKETSNKGHEDAEALAEFDELKTAMQDIQEMKGCYESLLSSSAMMANCAHELSQALHDMAQCLLQITALDINVGGGGVLKMLGEVQYDLHKLFDHYRAHISQTITTPSESLLNELQYVEELRCQCDQKRKLYEHMRMHKAKGKARNSKTDVFSIQQLKLTKDEYDEQATFLVCRLMSLKQGQSRTLLTQTARHHTSQLQLFRKGFASLEALEPHFNKIAKEQHIDDQMSELDDDGGASFAFRKSNCELDESANSENSFQVFIENNEAFRHNTVSLSAPFFSYEKSEGIEKTQGRQLQTSFQKLVQPHTLPTPYGAWNIAIEGGVNNSNIEVKKRGVGGVLNSQCQIPTSGQLKSNDAHKKITSSKSGLNFCNTYDSRSNQTTLGIPMPLPSSVERTPILGLETIVTSDPKKHKSRNSGPLIGKVYCNMPAVKSLNPLPFPRVESSSKSAPHSPKSCKYDYAKISPSISPSNLSPSHVNMLHQLPRPPIDSGNPSKLASFITHSAPLVANRTKESLASKVPGLMISRPASPLPPPPPGLMTRSLSIPSFGHQEKSHWIHIDEALSSPPQTPTPFPSSSTTSCTSKTAEDLHKHLS
ncbi:uncharacterized protein At2g33490 isoform X3 [Cryptomeria japonica]|uniref:uncharacterized protein At2g33490 isoform X3 n=1 Tax=Cryptomeria japonica TaxID=3369 RepID=UPI0027D9E496|nr:uncharacterized protein At2g33490 isoform X3 [Cryptomeria japonica]